MSKLAGLNLDRRNVREIVELRLKGDQDSDSKVSIVEESIEWANSQNYVFLRQALKARLIRLLNDLQRHSKALQASTELLRELKKVDDKNLLLEVQLEESRAFYYLSNLSKARASLTSARTIANAIYVTPEVQAGLDMQSGILHAADERDFSTAFSYFYEAFEGYDMTGRQQEAASALKYMLLCKIMLDKPSEINSLVSQKNALKYRGEGISFMFAIASASKNRSLKEFNEAFTRYGEELKRDSILRKHSDTLSDTMLEKELCRLIQPYSSVQISHIANKIELPVDKIEKKLAQMIMDKKLSGSLHQGDGVLKIYGLKNDDDAYDLSTKIIQSLNKLVDLLYSRSALIQ